MIKKMLSRISYGVRQRFLYVWQYVNYVLVNDNNNVVIFLIPGWEIRSGGILSIYSFYYETVALLGDQASVLMMSYPNSNKIRRYSWFENEIEIYPFDLFVNKKNSKKNLTIHIPEYYVKNFINSLNDNQINILKLNKNIHINILNQNIEYMPTLEELSTLSVLTNNVTCTTAHDSYTTPHYRDYYGLPIHKLSSWFDRNEIIVQPYESKKDVMIVSPDEHPLKEEVLSTIKQSLPSIELVVIRNMKYEDYKKLETIAKWSISFGEGLDGYLVGPVLRGGIGFAVYNEEFFTSEYYGLNNIFNSYESFSKGVIDFIKLNDNKENYEKARCEIIELVKRQFNYDDYKNNVKLFYDNKLTLP